MSVKDKIKQRIKDCKDTKKSYDAISEPHELDSEIEFLEEILSDV